MKSSKEIPSTYYLQEVARFESIASLRATRCCLERSTKALDSASPKTLKKATQFWGGGYLTTVALAILTRESLRQEPPEQGPFPSAARQVGSFLVQASL